MAARQGRNLPLGKSSAHPPTHDTLSDTGFVSDQPLSIVIFSFPQLCDCVTQSTDRLQDSNDESSNTEDHTENHGPSTAEEQSSWEIPPSEKQYDNAELADKAKHSWTREHKFELGWKKRLKRSSKSTGCRMSLHLCAVDRHDTDGKREITHHQNGKSLHHNHRPANSAVGLANHRSRACTQEQMHKIKKAHLARILASATAAMLENEDSIANIDRWPTQTMRPVLSARLVTKSWLMPPPRLGALEGLAVRRKQPRMPKTR